MDVPDGCSERSAKLVGRAVELGRLERAVTQLLGGSGGVLEIAGEPGIGKTLLLLELSADARSRGVQVLKGRATEAETGLGLGVYQDALGDRFRTEAAGLLLPPGLTDSLQPLLGNGPANELWADRPAPAGAERVRIHQRVRSLLGRWAEQAPTLQPLLGNGPANELWADRPAPAGAERVEVGPLSAAESATLACLAVGAGQSNGQADSRPHRWDEIHRESGGNPLLLLALADLAGGGEAAGPAAVLLGELALVPDDGRLLTAAAAVLGECFLVEALAEVAELGTERAHHAATTLIRRDILRPVAGTPQLTFRHPVLRRLVYQHADPVWRVGAHRRALARLTRSGAPAVERARHAERCLVDADPQVVRILEEAAEAALRTAPGDAARWLGVALQAIPDTPAEHDRRLRLELARTHALATSGRLSESRDLLHEVLARVPTDPLDRRIETATLCARTERMLGHYSQAEALLRGELPRIEGRPSPQAVALMTEYGIVALLTGGFADADRFVEQAVRTARELGDPPAEATALAVRGLGSIYLGRVDRARRTLAACAALADRLPDADLACQPEALAQLGWGELLAEQYADAARHHERGLRLTRRNGQDHVVPHLLLGIGFRQFWTGELRRAERTAAEAEQAAREIGSRELGALAMALRAAAMDPNRRPAADGAALALAERAVRSAPGGGWWSRSAVAIHAQTLLTAGQPERCARVLLEAGGGPELPLAQVTFHPLWYAMLSAAALATGDVAAAERWAAQADTAADRLGLCGPHGFA
ncbi:AAA family ATPase, partial [Kitasatospora sp. P5_F3]